LCGSLDERKVKMQRSYFSPVPLLLVAGLFFAACGGNQVNLDLEPRPGEDFINQDSVAVVNQSAGVYRLGYADVIEIKFFYNPELNQELIVRPDGRITLPRLGDLFVVGLTPSQLDDIITAKYSEIIRDPDITVIVKEFASQIVYVLGEVNLPGGYDLAVNMTAIQSVALAGGLTPEANIGSVILIRADGVEAQAKRVDLKKAMQSGNLIDDQLLQPFDIVYVPNHFIDKVDVFMEKYFHSFLPPFDLYLRAYDSIHPRRAVRIR
jgi:polysaccharide export outer membrane protein